MPVPLNVVSLEQFRTKLANHRAREFNIRAQEHFCYWCGEFAIKLIAKYWHGFCKEECWREYRNSRLRRS